MKLDKRLGTIFGVLVGDALGTTFEFRDREIAIENPITEIVGGGVYNLKKGYFTDDGSMTLCSLKSLIDCGKFDYCDHLNKFVSWWKNGYFSPTGKCFDIGMQTKRALAEYVENKNIYSMFDNNSAGNGSLMRISPVGLYYTNESDAIFIAQESSKLTHNNNACIDSCRYYTYIIHCLVNDKPIDFDYFDKSYGFIDNNVKNAILEVENLNYFTLSNSGYVVTSLASALYCFYNSNSFEECVLMAAHLAGDSDTIAAIAGGLAGAKYGYDKISDKFKKCIWEHDSIFKMINDSENLEIYL